MIFVVAAFEEECGSLCCESGERCWQGECLPQLDCERIVGPGWKYCPGGPCAAATCVPYLFDCCPGGGFARPGNYCCPVISVPTLLKLTLLSCVIR